MPSPHHQVKPDDVIGVVGSSHSAILVLRNLLNLPEGSIKKVVNLYRSPLLYAEYKEGYILYDNTGESNARALVVVGAVACQPTRSDQGMCAQPHTHLRR